MDEVKDHPKMTDDDQSDTDVDLANRPELQKTESSDERIETAQKK
jgi:hypothetical protein